MFQKQILIAEDDFTSRELLRAMLEKNGFEVICAEDGEVAWTQLQKPEAPSLIILDWMMPRLNGPEVCELLRSTKHGETCYVIVLTCCEDMHEIQAAMAAGADDLILKPFNTLELLSRIRLGFRFVGLLKENQRLQERLIQAHTSQ